MNISTLASISLELQKAAVGRRFGKIFQLAKFDMAVDLRLPDSSYLFISVEPADPRIYLIRRRLRDLEKGSGNPSQFALLLRKRLSGAEVTAVEHIENERVLRIGLYAVNELGAAESFWLTAQLTGRSANLFLADANNVIIDSARETSGEGQQAGDIYSPPPRPASASLPDTSAPPDTAGFGSLSEKLDADNLQKKAEQRFASLANSAVNKLGQEIKKRKRLIKKLNSDLEGHGDPEKWKRFGDLLLANVSTAERDGDRTFVIDYFSDAMETVEIEVDRNDTVTEAAEKFFRKYTKSRNARVEVERRLAEVGAELVRLEAENERLKKAVSEKDEDLLAEFAGAAGVQPIQRGRKQPVTASGTRSFTSSDNFEILVGKKAKDNDFLTFRVAKSLDTWLHAADYAGSHVVIRNPNRKEIPHSTLIEAAQLAAFYSQGKSQPKAAVHYTQKKFVNKPKGAAPGLVSLASFKTILVEPKVPFEGQ